MPYDYAKLMGKIVEKKGTQGNFAKDMGISEHTISLKLNGKAGWKQAEIEKACSILNIEPVEISSYFFTQQVQNN